MSQRLDEAVSIAKAAEACADTGNQKQAVEIIMGVEPLVFAANTLLNGATLLQDSFKPKTATRFNRPGLADPWGPNKARRLLTIRSTSRARQACVVT